jgi:hypothetical protein
MFQVDGLTPWPRQGVRPDAKSAVASGFAESRHLSADKETADEIDLSPAAPKGAIDSAALAISLKRYPDTNRLFSHPSFRTSKAGLQNRANGTASEVAKEVISKGGTPPAAGSRYVSATFTARVELVPFPF